MLQFPDHVLDYVDDYFHQLLSRADATYVEQHCQSCRLCKVALEEAQKRFAVLEVLPAREASGALIGAILEKIERYERKRQSVRRLLLRPVLVVTAAAIAVLATLHVYYLNLAPTPLDLRVFGQSELRPDTNGSLRIQLLNHDTGTALAGVPVDIELRGSRADQFIHLASFTTNAQGTGQPRFRLPDWADGPYQLHVVAHTVGAPESVTQTIRLKRSWKLMLSSDKPVYQPGQEIRLRALALYRPDLKPVAGQDVMFAITDPKGNVIFKRQDVTSKYGIAATDCPLASEILEGPYTVTCKVGDTASQLTVEVQKYVLPKFKVAVELDQSYYQPGQRVRGTVQADYFFGKPVAEGTVAIEVHTADGVPKLAQRLSARTNGTGAAMFDFTVPETLIGREQDSGDARITLLVSVSDPAGQKQTKSVSRVVTAQPLRVEVIPEAGALVADVPNAVYLFASYPDGRPARARLAVSGVEQELLTNALGVASLTLTPETNPVDLTIRATDDQGRIGRRQVRLACGQVAQDFLVRTDRAVYDGGETVHLLALGGGREPIFVDFIKDGQTVLTATLEMANGRGAYQVDLPPELFGTVELCAYRFSASGLPLRKTRALYVRQARQLKLHTTLDRAEYRPGERAQLQLALTDDQGKPVPGALSLAAVDEAVFAVLDRAPGMERTFYTLEQGILRPIYAIYPWSPDLPTSTPPAERKALEQALFARTTQTVAGQRTDSPHTLLAESFPAKVQQVEATRSKGLDRIDMAWIVLVVAIGVLAYILLWVADRMLTVVLIHLVGLPLLCGMMVPSLGCSSQAPMESPARHAAPAPSASVRDLTPGRTRDGAPVPEVESIVVAGGGGKEGAAPVRVRELFPETLLWRPELITDDQGHASLDVELADSITTWRLTASAITADGRLGAIQAPLRVFQPFFVDLNLPVALTRGDEVAVPVVLYNYLDRPQTVELMLEEAPWFERLEDAAKRIELTAHEVRSTAYRLRVTKVGNHHLQVTARGSGVADAIKRSIEVVPDGRRVEQVFNGSLRQPADLVLSVPEHAIEGSPKAILKIYPSSFSQIVEGLDAIFRMPYGCFEQTSSTTYPNVLALDYLRRTQKRVPEVEAKARQYIHLGYQRLLSFEVPSGGFDWFGRPPANHRLTAYGLMEFQDMAKVHDVDAKLIERTRQWLLAQRNTDGSWSESPGLHAESDPARGLHGDLARLSTTAYIAWAVFAGAETDFRAQATRSYLLSYKPQTIDDPYVLALVCNALIAVDPHGLSVRSYLERLQALQRTSEDGKLVWWEQATGRRTAFYGAGRSGSIETTALATLALIQGGSRLGIGPDTIPGALAWLVQQKDASGTWQSTQATVLALKALLAGTSTPLGGPDERRIEIVVSNGLKREVVIPADQAEVMKQINLSEYLRPGEQRLTLRQRSGTAANYQVTFRYAVPGEDRLVQPEAFAIELAYDRTELGVGETVTATATVRSQLPGAAPMVILDLPIPAGFALVADDFAKLMADGIIAKYQAQARRVIVYLRALEPGKPALALRYRLRATMAVKVTVPPARVYEYYDPDKHGSSPATQLIVTQRH